MYPPDHPSSDHWSHPNEALQNYYGYTYVGASPAYAPAPNDSCYPPPSAQPTPARPAPARSPRAQQATQLPATVSLAAEQPARKRKRKLPASATAEDRYLEGIRILADSLLRDTPLADVLAADRAVWRSWVYAHYIVTASWLVVDNKPTIVYTFTCIHKDPKHSVTLRRRGDSKHGTRNLVKKARACNDRNGRPHTAIRTLEPAPAYSEALHRAMIAIRCCKRPVNMVLDDIYLDEVRMLSGKSNLRLPSPQTVQHDQTKLFEGFSGSIAEYFEDRGRRFHAVNDGWLTPIRTSVLGVVLIWESEGRLYRVLLELITLTERHRGAYMAKELADLLKRYKIDHFLHFMNMDNASNCDTLARELHKFIPHFRGMPDRLRCFLHIVQLIAKIILKFFNPEYKRSTASTTSTTTTAAPTTSTANTTAPATGTASTASSSTATAAEAASSAEDEQIAEVLEAEALQRAIHAQISDDAGQSEHDEEVVCSKKIAAITAMQNRQHDPVVITSAESRLAKSLMPKVAGLAIRIRDSGPVSSALRVILDNVDPVTHLPLAPIDPTYATNITTVSTRNATRWDSDFDCLRTTLALRPALELLTSDPSLKLGAFKLNDALWSLAVNLCDVLWAIKAITMHFQKAVPLIVDVFPAFILLRQRLINMSEHSSLPATLRTAAYAGLLVSEEYFNKLLKCRAYAYAIALCPDMKLDWFRVNGFHEGWVQQLRRDIIAEFRAEWKTTPPASSAPPQGQNTAYTASMASQAGPSRFDSSGTSGFATPHRTAPQDLDDITVYLDSPCSQLRPIPTPGSPGNDDARNPVVPILYHWHLELARTPDLANMALTYVSAPATSVDVECAFSISRNQVAWNQHQTSPATLKTKSSLNAWSHAPWFDMEAAGAIVASYARALSSG